MTDRELLELAAKAAGYAAKEMVYMPGDDFERRYLSVDSEEWNPLEDDGDALRLAVTLGLGISIPLANKRTDVITFTGPLVSVIEAHGDPFAATRRAIVRAAAEIGKAMP